MCMANLFLCLLFCILQQQRLSIFLIVCSLAAIWQSWLIRKKAAGPHLWNDRKGKCKYLCNFVSVWVGRCFLVFRQIRLPTPSQFQTSKFHLGFDWAIHLYTFLANANAHLKIYPIFQLVKDVLKYLSNQISVVERWHKCQGRSHNIFVCILMEQVSIHLKCLWVVYIMSSFTGFRCTWNKTFISIGSILIIRLQTTNTHNNLWQKIWNFHSCACVHPVV